MNDKLIMTKDLTVYCMHFYLKILFQELKCFEQIQQIATYFLKERPFDLCFDPDDA